MTGKQESKLKMYLTLQAFLLLSPAITAKIPNFPALMVSLDAAILQIQTNSKQQEFNGNGETTNKKQLRIKLVNSTDESSRKLYAYAFATNNVVLQAECKFTLTELRDLSELKLINIANGIHDRIDSHLSELPIYQLTRDTQVAFKVDITAFENAIPKQTELDNKESKRQMNDGFEKGDKTTATMDTMVEVIRTTESVFYVGYKNARLIHDLGTGSLQVQGYVTEATTGNPIAYATLMFRLQGQTDIALEKETADKGRFKIKSLDEGIYDVTTSKVGFKTQTITAIVSWDKLCVLDIKMENI
jgi:hypothetical protein